jgi:tetratricopeptide (TPR) repeat protein
MKQLTISLFILSVLSFTAVCQQQTLATASVTPAFAPANIEYKDASGNINLLGKSSRERLAQTPFDAWFNKNYAEYTIDTAAANQIKALVKDKQFLIFMGTWCGDSRREVPRMYKLLDYCGVKPSQIQLVNVNNHDTAYKQSPTHEERGLYISRVPDLLVYDSKQEKGRIVESPVSTLEKDLLAILSNKAYSPQYPATAYLAHLFQSTEWMSTPANHQQAAEQLRSMASHWGELASFGRVLIMGGETDKAIDALRINTLLFPAEPDAFNYLANAYVKKGNRSAAKECCQTVLRLQPGNQQATAMLDQLNKQ